MTDILAIDYGTSNSAVAVWDGGAVRRIPLEDAEDTLPTAVFFPAEKTTMQLGRAAAEALIAGTEGRYMRALKSILGTPLFEESRMIGGKRRSLSDITTAFLTEVKARAEHKTGLTFHRALSGRPVHFHNDPERDERAAQDLTRAYLAAGYDEVEFVAEPEAAALAATRGQRGSLRGLVVDIGGGTSDFTVFESEGAGLEVLASHGIRLGGTDFDHAVSLAHAMPTLGYGGQLKRDFGPGLLPVPNAIYVDLATWARIPFLYTPESRRLGADMLAHAVDRPAISRLVTVLEDELGHELAFAVEKAKISANGPEAAGRIGMGFIEPRLEAQISAQSLAACLARYREALIEAGSETLNRAGLLPQDIDRVVLVGGSSLMQIVTEAAQMICPEAEMHRADAFTAVVDGLAIASSAWR